MSDAGPFQYAMLAAIVILVGVAIYQQQRISGLEDRLATVKQVTDQVCFVDQSGYKVIRPCS